jgi:glycosyltransferase involved in cell wall biosynthesis
MTAAASVTLGMPVYNGAAYVDEAIRSVIGQTFEDFVLVVGDNASTDETPEIVRRWAAADPRVELRASDRNRGLAWNWNRLLDEARTPYFRWTCHDDVLRPRLLERLVATMDSSSDDVVLAYPRTVEIDDAGEELGWFEDLLAVDEPHPHQRLRHLIRHMRKCNPLFGLMRTATLRSAGRLGGYGHADRVLLAELAVRGRFHEVPERLFCRRIHDRQSLAANPTAAELDRLYDPSVDKRFHLAWSRVLAETVRRVAAVPLSPAERVRCLSALFSEWRHYRPIVREVAAVTREAGKVMTTARSVREGTKGA